MGRDEKQRKGRDRDGMRGSVWNWAGRESMGRVDVTGIDRRRRDRENRTGSNSMEREGTGLDYEGETGCNETVRGEAGRAEWGGLGLDRVRKDKN